MEYPPVASLRARRVFCPKPPCVGIAGGADRARRRSTRRKWPLGRGRRNERRYLGGDHRGYVRGSDQLGDGGGRRGHGARKGERGHHHDGKRLKTFTVSNSKTAGLALAQSSDGVVTVAASAPGPAPADLRATQLRLLDAVPLFAHLTEDEKEALAASMTRRTFRTGEVLVEQGRVLKCLMILRRGVAVVTRRDDNGSGKTAELARLAPGDFFGESGLLAGAGEPGCITVLTGVVVYEIPQERLGA
jgi:hypothetical protein